MWNFVILTSTVWDFDAKPVNYIAFTIASDLSTCSVGEM